jgi:hypothetical protein
MSSAQVPSTIAVKKHIEAAPDEVKKYFEHLPKLIDVFPWEVAIAYQFVRVERAQNRALYGGVVKLHRAHGEVAEPYLSSLYITRETFLKHYATVFGQSLPSSTVNKLKFAEKVRDKTVHGKNVDDAAFRRAVVDVIEYAALLNAHVQSIAGFKPFGDMRGFKGAGQPLEKSTTRWLLKGILATQPAQ